MKIKTWVEDIVINREVFDQININLSYVIVTARGEIVILYLDFSSASYNF